MVVHLETTFLFKVTHGKYVLMLFSERIEKVRLGDECKGFSSKIYSATSSSPKRFKNKRNPLGISA